MEEKEENSNSEETEVDGKIKYTLPQRVFIYKSYVKNESAKICRREFRKAFPNVLPPKNSRIIRLTSNFERTGLLLDVKTIEDKHIKELENEAKENKKRKVAIPSVLESSAVEDQNSTSEGGPEDISSMIKTEIKSEPPSSPEHETGSNRLEFVPIKKEPKDAALDGEESMSSSNSDGPSTALQAPEWGLVEDSSVPSTFTTPDATLPYSCRHCGCCFRTYTDLKSHISEMHAEMVKCGECGKEFPTRSQLQRHETQHVVKPKPPFTCIECKKEFLSKGRLTSHIKKSHVKSEKPRKEKKTKRKKE